ncbi:MAG: antibiotic biosynthesis monooxygenase [Defluviitaleaceae bacterium]|nr:antibiotic biosynthesis monooxygenase [Defluviitaleaceae bacterium]MCL2240156.1 antibiotic biosynthesis monooxygenase [Defluviitaleaceae bacterium]
MAKVMYVNTYKLKKGADVPAFKAAVARLVQETFTREAGCLSFKLLAEGDAWADYSLWETMEAYNAFLERAHSNPSEAAKVFYAFLNFNTCKSHVYTVELDLPQ